MRHRPPPAIAGGFRPRGAPAISRAFSDLRRPDLGNGYILSPEGKAVLRAIRARVDDEGVYRGGPRDAARLADMPEKAAEAALNELASRGFIRLVDRRRAR